MSVANETVQSHARTRDNRAWAWLKSQSHGALYITPLFYFKLDWILVDNLWYVTSSNTHSPVPERTAPWLHILWRDSSFKVGKKPIGRLDADVKGSVETIN